MSWKERQCSQTTKCQLIVIGANSAPRGFTICGVGKEGSLFNVNSSIMIQQSYGEAQSVTAQLRDSSAVRLHGFEMVLGQSPSLA